MSDTLQFSESIAEFAPAYCALQAELPKIPKDRTGQAGNQKTKYADLETTIELIKPILARHGFSFLQPCSGGSGGHVSVTTILLHKTGEWMRDTVSMPVGGNGAQGVGSAISYGKRYALTSLLGLATEDDDGDAATRGTRQRQPAQAKDQPAPDAGAISEAQRRAMAASFRGIGITERDERIGFICEAIGRQVESSSDLTKQEASRVIDAIKAKEAA